MDKQPRFSSDAPLREDYSPAVKGRGLIPHLALILLFGLIVILINPRGYTGGGYDDGRYLAAATEWALHGPVLGPNHWSLRWPIVLPTAAILRIFGPDHDWLMLPGVVAYFAIGFITYFGVRGAAGARAGFLAGLGIMATPGIGFWSGAIYPDLIELALWLAAFWSLWRATHAPDRQRLRWMIATGLIAGFAICVRETSIALAAGLFVAGWFLPRMPLRAWIMALIAVAALPTIEYAILWAASGDPIYRLHVDLHHIAIPSEDMRGAVATNQLAVFNTGIMERWAGAGPVHLHWMVDTYINFFLNFYYGQNYVAALALALCARRRGGVAATLGPKLTGLVPALLTIAAANIVWNLYVLALNPSDRMFMPATAVATIIAAILADRLWTMRFVRPFLVVVMLIKLLSTVVVADTIPNYQYVDEAAERITGTTDPIYVTWQTHSNLALANPAYRRRLSMAPVPVGGRMLVYASIGEPYVNRLGSGRWLLIDKRRSGRSPVTIRFANVLAGVLGSKPLTHADVEARFFERLPGTNPDIVVVDAKGRVLPPNASSR